MQFLPCTVSPEHVLYAQVVSPVTMYNSEISVARKSGGNGPDPGGRCGFGYG